MKIDDFLKEEGFKELGQLLTEEMYRQAGKGLVDFLKEERFKELGQLLTEEMYRQAGNCLVEKIKNALDTKDEDKARNWFYSPLICFGGKRPYDYCKKGN